MSRVKKFNYALRNFRHDVIIKIVKMDSENLALAQEEATLTKIRNFLNSQKVKLWEPPYYDSEKKRLCEESVHELAVTVTQEVQLPRAHVFQGLQMLQQHALEKLAARDKFKESGIANLKLRFSKNLKSRQKTCDIDLTSPGSELSKVTKMKIICECFHNVNKMIESYYRWCPVL